MAQAAKSAPTLGARMLALWNSETGPKTTHFWGPVANWGFVLAVRLGSFIIVRHVQNSHIRVFHIYLVRVV